jgi:hypothetical protein
VRTLTIPQGAILSPCRSYRYLLWRSWQTLLPTEDKGYAMFVGLNPSTADETENDATIRRCIRFAQDWGYHGLCMANLFAFRTVDPQKMMASADPVGPENDQHLLAAAGEAGIIVAAWGAMGDHLGRSGAVAAMLPEMHCLRLTKSGQPGHPLYIPSSAQPQKWIAPHLPPNKDYSARQSSYGASRPI